MNFGFKVVDAQFKKNFHAEDAKKANFGPNLDSALQVHFATDFNMKYHSELRRKNPL